MKAGRASAAPSPLPFGWALSRAEAAEQPADQLRTFAGGMHILIVEDVDLNADLLADLLELEDITTERAENGRVAVDPSPGPRRAASTRS